ncbi:Otopetrin-1-like protein [Dinothrombium tinctorium]|uniref:Otopetrin-1-like protein n=1 Tax=Dinothrombium tinctorium TaxID=1965070 RepID=A0A443RLM7_9ACAR|nr:Otopetrin-1-like protein [Dinothrombium tinctorium]
MRGMKEMRACRVLIHLPWVALLIWSRSLLATIGVIWLTLLHYDLQKYKGSLVKKIFPNGNLAFLTPLESDGIERLSTATEVIFNNSNIRPRSTSAVSIDFTNEVPRYRFLRGPFCFGHIIHEGLTLSQQVYFLSSGEFNCVETSKFILCTVRPLYSFYQLFMLFKYSNIVINCHLYLAQFGLMHMIGTSVTFWIGAILDDSVEYLENKIAQEKNNTIELNMTENFRHIYPDYLERMLPCRQKSIPSNKYDSALPYLYPFAIEFNLLLAALWFVMWRNIGKDSHTAHPHHFQHKVSQDHNGKEEVHFESNLVLRADCHASNKGLFGGMFILLVSLITMILFFVSVNTSGYIRIAIYIYSCQEIFITGVIAIVSIFAYREMRKLDINPIKSDSHVLDSVLLMIPLPFYFLNNLLSIRADIATLNWVGIAMQFTITFQVLIHTVFISDAMNKCSEDRNMRFQKPGRELITLMIILNITLWIISTFETKSTEKYMSQSHYYGSVVWMVLSHLTLPLMLFYRFHCTVCLADIWKFAYEKAH